METRCGFCGLPINISQKAAIDAGLEAEMQLLEIIREKGAELCGGKYVCSI